MKMMCCAPMETSYDSAPPPRYFAAFPSFAVWFTPLAEIVLEKKKSFVDIHFRVLISVYSAYLDLWIWA